MWRIEMSCSTKLLDVFTCSEWNVFTWEKPGAIMLQCFMWMSKHWYMDARVFSVIAYWQPTCRFLWSSVPYKWLNSSNFIHQVRTVRFQLCNMTVMFKLMLCSNKKSNTLRHHVSTFNRIPLSMLYKMETMLHYKPLTNNFQIRLRLAHSSNGE